MNTKEKQKNRTSLNEMFYNKKTQRLEKIDNRLVKKERRLENVNNKTKIQFNDLTQEEDLLVLQEDECKLSMKLLGKKEKEQIKFAARQVKQLQDKKVLYEDVFEDSDVEYEILEDKKIKENIVIKNNNKETYEYQYLLTLENLTLKQEQNTKTLKFVNEKEKALFTIVEPVMFDSNKSSSNDITYEVKQLEENKYLLTLKANENWVNSKERVLPIYLDPVVTITNNHPFKWYRFDNGNGFNYLEPEEIYCTELKWDNETRYRLMLAIDDDLITLIKKSNPSSLEITFYCSEDCGNLGVKYTNKSTNEYIGLSDFDDNMIYSTQCVYKPGYGYEIKIDIANAVKNGNRTFLFYEMAKKPELITFNFCSYECNFYVEFDTPTTNEDNNKEYRTYRIGNDILIHKELIEGKSILKEINNLFNVGFINFSLIYGKLNYKFLNFDLYNCNYNLVVEDNSRNDEFILYDEKGTEFSFKKDDDNKYYYVADKKLKLKKVNGKVVIYTNSKILKFITSSDSKYYLLESISTNTLDNMISITYENDRICQISDAYGNIASFTYNSDNNVWKITINTDEELNFFYNEYKSLNKITHMIKDKLDRTIILSPEIEDSYGYKGEIYTDLDGSFTFKDLVTGKSEKIEYLDNLVKIIDNLGNETHIIKDKKSNIISKYSFNSGGKKLKGSINYCTIERNLEEMGTKINTYYDSASIEVDDEVIASGLKSNCIYNHRFNNNPIYYLFMLETAQNSNTLSYSLTQDELDKLVHGNSYTYGLFIKTLSQRVPLHKLYDAVEDAECQLKLKINYSNGKSKQLSRDIDTSIQAWQFIALSFTHKPTDSTISGITLSLSYTRPTNELKKNIVFSSPMLKISKNYYYVSDTSKYRLFKGVLKFKETTQYYDGVTTFSKYDENCNLVESKVTDTFQSGVVLHNEYEYGDFNQLEKETRYFEGKEKIYKTYEYSKKSYNDIDFSTCKLLSLTTECNSKKIKLKYEYDQYGNQNPLFNEKDTKILEYDFYLNGDIKTEKYNLLADKNYEYQNSRIWRISSSMDYSLMSYNYNCYYTYENGGLNSATVNNTLQYLFESSDHNLTQNVKIKNLNTNVVNNLYSTTTNYNTNQTVTTENIGDDFKREYKYSSDGDLEYIYENNNIVYKLTKNTNNNSHIVKYKVDTDTNISKESLFDSNNKLYRKIFNIHGGFIINYGDFNYIDNSSEYSLNYNDTVLSYKYKYNNRIEGRLEEVVMPFSVNKISYDSLGRVSYSEMHSNNSTVLRNIYTYQDMPDSRTTQFVSKIEHKSFHYSGNETLCSEYGYQSNGNINYVKIFDKTRNYIYDTFNRLIDEENQAFNESISYVYDVNGNLLSTITYNVTTKKTTNKQFTYNGFNQLTKMLKPDGTLTEISYDNLGNPININITRPCDNEVCLESYDYPLEFERGTRLKSFGDVTFKYDENGIRISKQKGNTLHKYYVNGNIIHKEEIVNLQTNNIEETIYYFYDSTGVASFKKGNNVYYYLKDLTGNIIGIYNDTGTLVAKYEYDAWGNHKVYDQFNQETTLKTFVGNINPFRYKSYYYDSETQLFYCNSRYYSPELCRWISPDSIEYLDPQSINGLNLYAYCGNDPINKYDPTGHSAIALLIAFGIGAVLGGIYGGVSAAANRQNVWKGIVIGAVVGGLTGLITEVTSVPLMLLGTFAVGAGGDIASQMILDEKSFGEVNLISAAWAGVANAGLALVGKGLSIVDKMAGLTTAESIIFGTMTNSPLLSLGMAINMGISKHASVYTVNDLYNDTFGKYKQLTWRW